MILFLEINLTRLRMILRQYFWLIALTLALWLVPHSVFAATARHALIIGNSNYQNSYLNNPKNDAIDIATALQKLDYTLFENKAHIDVNLEEMEDLVAGFSANLPRDAIAVVYFAGHGISSKRESYLIPVRSRITKESQVRHRALSLSYLLDQLKDGNNKGLNVVLLDACRNNPFGSQFRSTTRGLYRPSTLAQGTFVGLSAGEGQVASDGEGRNGLYTTHLLEALDKHPGKPIEQVHKIIARDVYNATVDSENPQSPIYQSDVFGEYCFGVCGSGQQMVSAISVVALPSPPADTPRLDTTGPRLNHSPLTKTITANQSQTISAKVSDNTAIKEVLLFYRSGELGSYNRLELSTIENSEFYMAQLPASAITTPQLHYYLEARDEAGNVTVQGSEEHPITLGVKEHVKDITPLVNAETIVKPENPSHTSSSKKWLWIGLGVLTAGALLSTSDPGPSESVTLTINTTSPSSP